MKLRSIYEAALTTAGAPPDIPVDDNWGDDDGGYEPDEPTLRAAYQWGRTEGAKYFGSAILDVLNDPHVNIVPHAPRGNDKDGKTGGASYIVLKWSNSEHDHVMELVEAIVRQKLLKTNLWRHLNVQSDAIWKMLQSDKLIEAVIDGTWYGLGSQAAFRLYSARDELLPKLRAKLASYLSKLDVRQLTTGRHSYEKFDTAQIAPEELELAFVGRPEGASSIARDMHGLEYSDVTRGAKVYNLVASQRVMYAIGVTASQEPGLTAVFAGLKTALEYACESDVSDDLNIVVTSVPEPYTHRGSFEWDWEPKEMQWRADPREFIEGPLDALNNIPRRILGMLTHRMRHGATNLDWSNPYAMFDVTVSVTNVGLVDGMLVLTLSIDVEQG